MDGGESWVVGHVWFGEKAEGRGRERVPLFI